MAERPRPDGGPRVAGYTDLERVGSGGFSNVYRAHQEGFDRTVALKVLTVELFDEKAQHRFERECRASGRLSNHPYVVTVLDSGFTEDGRPFMATEFMSNGALSDRLEATGPFPLDEVLAIGVKMCGALAAVHGAGILHRDIKPQNILVSDYGEPALADFGISAITVGPGATTGTSSLTPLHTAPEILEGRPTSVASDVYSLGSTLYMLLAGRAPFQGEDEEGLLPLMRRVVTDPVPDIDRPDVPGVVTDVLRWAMAKDPAARYASAAAFGEALQQLQAHLSRPVTPLTLPGGRTTALAAAAEVPRPTPPATPPAPAAAPPTAEPALDPPAEGAPPVDAPVMAAPAVDVPAVDAPAVAAPAGRSRIPLVVGGLAVVVVVALLAGLVLRGGTTSDGGGTTAAGGPGSPGTTGRDGPSGSAGGSLTWPADLRFDVEPINLPEPGTNRGGTLRVLVDQDPGGWNPAAQRFAGDARTIAEAVFEPLAILTDEGPVPYLASSITPNDTADEWTIELPAGVRFSDGTALDAEAVQANLEARTTSELFRSWVQPVERVEARGGTTVVVHLDEPWPAFPVVLTTQVGDVAAPATLTGDGSTGVGTGPFVLADWQAGTSVTVTRNPTYRQPDRPYLDGIEFTVADADARRADLAAGRADLAGLTDPEALDTLTERVPTLLVRQSSLATAVLNTSTPPLDDVRLRKALSMAVDREEVNATVFGGRAVPTESPFPSGSPWAQQGASTLGSDAEQARALVDEARADGTDPTLTLYTGTSAKQQQMADLLAARWRAVGVTVTVESPEDGALQHVLDGDYQAALWTYDVPTDPDEWYPWFHSSSVTDGDTWFNLPRLASPAVDRALDQGRTAPSLDERLTAYGGLEQALIDQAPAVWLAFLPDALVSGERGVGLTAADDGGLGRGGRPWAVDANLP